MEFWGLFDGTKFVPQPAVAVRGATKAEADRLEAEAKAAIAAAWDAAAARGPDAVVMSGASGKTAKPSQCTYP